MIPTVVALGRNKNSGMICRTLATFYNACSVTQIDQLISYVIN